MKTDLAEQVQRRLPPSLLGNPDWQGVREGLWREVRADHNHSLRKAIVDYVLMDSGELARLKIASVPRDFTQEIIRAPIPWHESLKRAREAQSLQLFTTNVVMQQLQELWHDKWADPLNGMNDQIPTPLHCFLHLGTLQFGL